MKQHALRDGAVSFQFAGELPSRELDELLESAVGENLVTHHPPATAKP